MARRALRSVPAAVAVALAACSREPPAPTSSASSAPLALPASAAPPAPSAPDASAAVSVSDAEADVKEEPSLDALPPFPHVEVTNIGMHIGGGPNDAASKDPIARAVAPHFDDFRRCYGRVEPPRPGDFGEFDRLKTGKTKVSYSLRFAP